METRKMLTILVLGLALMVWPSKLVGAERMGTAFSYQGRLIDANSAAEGLYDLQFKLFDDPNVILGMQLGSAIDLNDLDIIDGYFAIGLDFGDGDPNVFNGAARWLEMAVRPGDSNDVNDFVILSPRQQLMPSPYAIYAETAGVAQALGGADGSATTTVYVDTEGKVGIGTTTPTAKLDVEGDIHASETISSGSSLIIDGLNDRITATSGSIDFDDENLITTGKVAIGMTTPREALEVVGTVKATSFMGDGSELTGIIGEPGPQGPAGQDGADGAAGSQGSQGPAGQDGAPGEKGDPGLPGQEGQDGAPGEKGDPGLPGQDGQDGAPGEKGDPGLPGQDGQDGAPGEQGLQGPIGLTGPEGPEGIQGEQGAAGPTLGIYDSLGLKSSKDHKPGDAGARTLYNLGNVGIGTTKPKSKLSVGGEGLDDASVYGRGGKCGVYGRGDTGCGVHGSGSSIGVYGEDSDSGAYGRVGYGDWGGYFSGDGYFSGNVGIGTTNPVSKLEVNGRLELPGNDASGTAGTGVIEIGNSLRLDDNEIITNTDEPLYIQRDNNGDLFVDNGTLTVDASANNVGIGTTSPGYKLTVSTAEPTGRGVYGQASNTGNYENFGGYFYAEGKYGRGVCGYATGSNGIGVSGSSGYKGVRGFAMGPIGKGVAGYGMAYDFYAEGPGDDYGSSSSIRWKKDIRVIDDPIGKVLRLRGVYFKWDAEHGGHDDVGMIAEEVGEVLPEIVQYEEDGVYTSGMDYSKLTPLLVEAVKELKAENDSLKQRLEALETTMQQQQLTVAKEVQQ